MANQKPTTFSFEKSLSELSQLVENMERGDLSLEESLKQFERGIQLTRQCQKALADVEEKVKILVNNNLEPYLKNEINNDEVR